MLRFSLGLPELEENLRLPRIIGGAGAVLIVANIMTPTLTALVAGKSLAMQNSLIAASSIPSSIVGLVLAASCMAMPLLDDVLTEQQARAGRLGDAATTKPLTIALDDELLDAGGADGDGASRRAELAWASYTLLRNTPAAAVVLCAGDAILMYRGEMGRDGRDTSGRQAFLRGAANVLSRASPSGARSVPPRAEDLLALDRDGRFFPDDLGDVTAFECSDARAGGAARVLLLLPEGARLGARDLSWSRAVAEKMMMSDDDSAIR